MFFLWGVHFYAFSTLAFDWNVSDKYRIQRAWLYGELFCAQSNNVWFWRTLGKSGNGSSFPKYVPECVEPNMNGLKSLFTNAASKRFLSTVTPSVCQPIAPPFIYLDAYLTLMAFLVTSYIYCDLFVDMPFQPIYCKCLFPLSEMIISVLLMIHWWQFFEK